MSQLSMWQKFHRENVAEQKNKVDTENKIPDWLQRYVEYKFNLYDRTGEIVFTVVFYFQINNDFRAHGGTPMFVKFFTHV